MSRAKKHKAKRQALCGMRGTAYARACALVERGEYGAARKALLRLIKTRGDHRENALLVNDLGAVAALEEDVGEAKNRFEAALALDPECEPARVNLAFLAEAARAEGRTADAQAPDSRSQTPFGNASPGNSVSSARSGNGVSGSRRSQTEFGNEGEEPADCKSAATFTPLTTHNSPLTKVAVLSFLFNWPSTGGGIVHTVELARFLAKAGFEVRHIYARFPAWGIGGVTGEAPLASEVIDFSGSEWNVPAIQARFRAAVDAFGPDYVIITDSWNMKPVLAEAVRGYRYIMRLQAMECLCPLNNLRLLPGVEVESGAQSAEREAPTGAPRSTLHPPLPRVRQCPLNQLANPEECRQCIAANGRWSGELHHLERGLAGVETPDYHDLLVRAMREAEAVLVVNPQTAELVEPFSSNVRVVTAGMDPARFEVGGGWRVEGGGLGRASRATVNSAPSTLHPPRSTQILFAGLVHEPSKGFHVLQQACELLWQRRKDFELVVTADPPGPFGEFMRFCGWLSQEELPKQLDDADIVAFPTIAQEALGRTAVEAMAAGRPVVASRIGGLTVTVQDGLTGLLCAPGDAVDLAEKLEKLLDDPGLRARLGAAGRKRFEEEYSWDVIIERHYRPLLTSVVRNQ